MIVISHASRRLQETTIECYCQSGCLDPMDERLTLNVAAARFGPRMRYYSLDHRRLFCFFVAGCRKIRVRIRTEGPAMAATVCAMANGTRIRRAFDNASSMASSRQCTFGDVDGNWNTSTPNDVMRQMRFVHGFSTLC